MLRHIEANVRVSLGTDVGGGTCFGIPKEALQSYFMQRLHPQGYGLTPAHLLYLATRAGAEALGLEDKIGDLSIGKAADLVYIRPPQGSAFESVLHHATTIDRVLAAVFTLAGVESIAGVWVEGEQVVFS